MKNKTRRLLALCMTVDTLVGITATGASAAGKTKTFTLPCGDGVTLSNYVDEKMDTLVINGEAETITYYLVDANTRISFNVTSGNNVEVDTIELIGPKEYDAYAGYYLGGDWGWPETSSVYNVFDFSDSPLSGVSMTDFDSEVVWAEDGHSYGFTDYISLYVMDSKQSANMPAAPTASNVLVNGKQTAFDAYTVDDNNYFKLRDLAFVLNGSGKQFEVTWDGANNAIMLVSGKAYTPAGGEMAGKNSGATTAVPTSAKILLDGKEIALTAYTIGDNNYFKLRDIGQAFNFGVTWDGTTNTISIDTATGYTK